MAIYTSLDGTIKEIAILNINDNGTIREIGEVYSNSDGVIVKIFPDILELLPYQFMIYHTSGGGDGTSSPTTTTTSSGPYEAVVGYEYNEGGTISVPPPATGQTVSIYTASFSFSPETECCIEIVEIYNGSIQINGSEKETGTYTIHPEDKVNISHGVSVGNSSQSSSTQSKSHRVYFKLT